MKAAAKVVLVAAFAGVSLAQLSACAPTQTRETVGEYVDDTTLTSKVKTALLADPVVKGTAIQVETYRGVVQLSGFVDNQDMANRAVQLASGVGGVRSVKNDMRLKPPRT